MTQTANMIKKKMSGKDFNPKQILGMPQDVREIVVGRLMGVANGITKTTSTDGEVLEGLAGQFIFKSNNKAMAADCASYVLWAPSGCLQDIFAAVKSAKAADGVNIVEFAYDVHVVRAENPAGYEWGFTPLLAPAANDPLAALEAKLGGTVAAPAIAAPDDSGEVIDGKAEKAKAKSA